MGVRGLLVQVAARSTRYAITDDGRRVYERILEMDAGRF
jgi:predicted transcriptional regulator